MNSSRFLVPSLAVPFEDADFVNHEAAQERHVGRLQPDDLLKHPPAYVHSVMSGAGGRISSPTTFISGVF
jgi:hypothetical protein